MAKEKDQRIAELESELDEAKEDNERLRADVEDLEKKVDRLEKETDRLKDVEAEEAQSVVDLVRALAPLAHRQDPAEVEYLLARASRGDLACELRVDAVLRPTTDDDVVRAFRALPEPVQLQLAERFRR